MLEKLLLKTTETRDIEKFDDIKTLIDMVKKLPNDTNYKKDCDINDMCY